MSACSASMSTTLPFPSSPHWAPTMIWTGMHPLRNTGGQRKPPMVRGNGRRSNTGHSLFGEAGQRLRHGRMRFEDALEFRNLDQREDLLGRAGDFQDPAAGP